MTPLEIDIALPRRTFELRTALSLGAETLALVGPSGAGKTSLLRSVAGLEHPRTGRITLAGDVWFDAQSRLHLSPERRRVGYLPQDYGLFPHLTVAGNVAFAGHRERPDLLKRLGIEHLAGSRPQHLSGGERQRVGLARALARDPRVLLLDEPFGALDAITRRQVRDELADELRGLLLPTLLVTHAFEDAVALAHRIGVIDQGRLLQLGTAAELLKRPAGATVAAISGANVLEATATPTGSGSILRLAGGGELGSSESAHGAVRIAVHPWELTIDAAAGSPLRDRILSVSPDRGGLLVRFTRFTILTPGPGPGPALAAGQTVGVRAAPSDIRILSPSAEQDEPDLVSAEQR